MRGRVRVGHCSPLTERSPPLALAGDGSDSATGVVLVAFVGPAHRGKHTGPQGP